MHKCLLCRNRKSEFSIKITFLELHDFRSFYLALYPQEHWPDQVFCCSAWFVCDTPDKQTISVFLHNRCQNIWVRTRIEDTSCCCLKANAGKHFLVSMICTHACRKKITSAPTPTPTPTHEHKYLQAYMHTHEHTKTHTCKTHSHTQRHRADKHTCTFL